MAVVNQPDGCCGATGLYMDTDQVHKQAQILQTASTGLSALVGTVGFADTANAFAGSDLATILNNGTNILDPALTSHADRASSTADGFTQAVKAVSNQDHSIAGDIAQVDA